jgi:heterodisulfide reductase subunit C
MVTLGFLDELLSLPEIWYCFSCRRCLQVCPNAVKPMALIEYLRAEAIRKYRISTETIACFKLLFARFQRVRWQAALACLKGKPVHLDEDLWYRWLRQPIVPTLKPVGQKNLFSGSPEFCRRIATAATSACFTCGECSSACPVSCERSVFDPRSIVRMAAMGLMHDLLESASIWLCLACGRCTEACSQMVDGRTLIKLLQQLALESGAVDYRLPRRLEAAARVITPRFLLEIDALFGFQTEAEMDFREAVDDRFCAVC